MINNNRIVIKNMVCPRCIDSVSQIFDDLKINYENVEIGHIKLNKNVSADDLKIIDSKLKSKGFEILEDEKTVIVERIKQLIVSKVSTMSFDNSKLSDEISRTLGYNYSYLSRIFSAVEGKSIERFLMNSKIQKIKELIRYENESLKQISFLLNYNSPSHMSNHFKKETGMTPSQFKKNMFS